MEQSQTDYVIKVKENKIRLADMMYYILLHWRSILLGAFVFCALLSCFKFMKGFNSLGSEDLSETKKTYGRSYEEYMIIKSQLESQADELAKTIKEAEDYQNQSILMNLNPEAAYKSTLTYAVNDLVDTSLDSLNPESFLVANRRINSILGSYASLIQSGTILETIQNAIGTQIDKKYIAELVYVQVDYRSKLLHITAFGEDKKQVQTISDAIEKGILDANLRISTVVGAHRLELMSSYTGNDVDTSALIGSIPEDGRSEDSCYQTSIESLQKNKTDAVTELQNQLIDSNNQLSELTEPSEPGGTSRTAIVKSSIKYGILGFIVGAFVMAYFYILQYVGGGKLMTPDEMQDTYGIPLLAYYKAPMCEHSNAIDNLINRVYGIPDRRFYLSDTCSLAVANVLARIKDTENVKILFAGNADIEGFGHTVSGV